MATTPVFLPRESPWTEESGGLQSMGSQRVHRVLEARETKIKVPANLVTCKSSLLVL